MTTIELVCNRCMKCYQLILDPKRAEWSNSAVRYIRDGHASECAGDVIYHLTEVREAP